MSQGTKWRFFSDNVHVKEVTKTFYFLYNSAPPPPSPTISSPPPFPKKVEEKRQMALLQLLWTSATITKVADKKHWLCTTNVIYVHT